MTNFELLSLASGILSALAAYAARSIGNLRSRIEKLERDQTGVAAVMGEIRDDVKEIRAAIFKPR